MIKFMVTKIYQETIIQSLYFCLQKLSYSFNQFMISTVTKKVVIIGGGGAAGIAAHRQLLREHHQVIAFQAAGKQCVGGVWSQKNPASVMYDNLRTNLPRQVMIFPSFPWNKVYVDDRQYPHHSQVQAYLQDYSKGLEIQFNQRVVSVEKESQFWIVKTDKGTVVKADAVVIANGHYCKPRIPEIQYIDFQGEATHSATYRNAESYKEKVMAVLGAYASGQDIARQLAYTAKKVYLIGFSHNFMDAQSPFGYQNKVQRITGTIKKVIKKKIVLQSGQQIPDQIDGIIFATGYIFDFPFFKGKGIQNLSWKDNHLKPLYYHITYIDDPSLNFIGLPWKIVPFPLFEFQCRFVAQHLSGKIKLPSKQQMQQWGRKQQQIQGKGRYYHMFGQKQISYNNMLAQQTNFEPLSDDFRKQLEQNSYIRKNYAENYRDYKLSPSDIQK